MRARIYAIPCTIGICLRVEPGFFNDPIFVPTVPRVSIMKRGEMQSVYYMKEVL